MGGFDAFYIILRIFVDEISGVASMQNLEKIDAAFTICRDDICEIFVPYYCRITVVASMPSSGVIYFDLSGRCNSSRQQLVLFLVKGFFSLNQNIAQLSFGDQDADLLQLSKQ